MSFRDNRCSIAIFEWSYTGSFEHICCPNVCPFNIPIAVYLLEFHVFDIRFDTGRVDHRKRVTLPVRLFRSHRVGDVGDCLS